MRARILSTLCAGIASLFLFPAFVAGGAIVAKMVGGATEFIFVVVVCTALVMTVGVFRVVHDVLILRWSNEPDPPVYGSWVVGRIRDIY